MGKLFKCTPLVNNAVFNIYTALNTIIENNLNGEEVTDLIFGAVLKTEPDFMTSLIYEDPEQLQLMYDYLQEVAIITQQIVPELSKEMGLKPSSVMSLVDNISDSLIVKINEFKNSLPSESTITNTKLNNKETSIEGADLSTADEVKENSLAEELDNISVEDNTLNNDELSFSDIIFNYFPGITSLKNEFETYVINSFYENIVNNKADFEGDEFNGNIPNVLSLMKQKFTKDLLVDQIKDTNLISSLPSKDVSIRNAYYAKIANQHFNSVVKEILPGIKDNQINFNSKSRRGISNYDGAFSGFDQISSFIKMFIHNTPKLNLEVSEDGKTVLSFDNTLPYITDSHIKSLASRFSSYSQNGISEFIDAMKSDVDLFHDEILASIYYRFFAPDNYIVDGTEYKSIFNIASSKNSKPLMNILLAIKQNISSLHACEHIIVENGNTIFTKTIDIAAVSTIKSDLESRIVDYKNPSYLSDHLMHSDKIVFSTNEEGNVIMTVKDNGAVVGNIILKKESIGSKGTLVNIEDTDLNYKLNDPNIASRILTALLGSSKLSRKDLLKQYKKISNNKSLSTQNISLANLVANITFGIAVNNKNHHAFLHNNNMLPVSNNSKPGTLPYPIFDYIYEFEPAILKAAESLGRNNRAFRKNINGDLLALTTNTSKFHDVKSFINRINKVGSESILHSSPLVNGVHGKRLYEIEDFYEIDGVKFFGNSKGANYLNLNEKFKYLIEHTFLQSIEQNRFKGAAIQPLVPSDRSKVELVLFKSLDSNKEFLPKYGNTNNLNVVALQNELIDSRKEYHNSLANLMLSEWKNFLVKNNFAKEQIDSIKDIKELAKFVKENKIPTTLVKASGLTEELMYVDNNGVANIKEIFLKLHDVWNNKEKALSYIDRMEKKFFGSLKSSGYYSLDLEPETVRILKSRFGESTDTSDLKKILVKGYFYHNLIISHDFNNLVAGSIYQFKTDLGKSSEEIGNNIKALVNKISNSKKYNNLSQEEKEKAIKDEIDKAKENDLLDLELRGMWTNQTKRHAPITSTITKPHLAKSNEKGLFLDTHSNSAVVEDKKVLLNLLGDLRPDVDQDAYDAVCFVTPLYSMKMNNSLGNEYSVLYNEGAPIKDVTITHDEKTGIQKIQKKSTFTISFEMLKNGSPELHNIFKKMFNTIPINLDIDGDKYNTIYDLWVRKFDGWSNKNSFSLLGNWLAENPEYRNKYIETVVFKSAEKTGSQNINTIEIYENPDKNIIYSYNDNYGHGVILSLGHDPDTTTSLKTDEDDSLVSIPTQFISAAIFEGATQEEAFAINNALKVLAESNLIDIQQSIETIALDLAKNSIESEDAVSNFGIETVQEIKSIFDKTELTKEDSIKLKEFIKQNNIDNLANEKFVKELVKETVATREHSGAATTLINNIDDFTAGALQLQGIVQSSVNSHVNNSAVKVKFKGGQYVVAPAHEFLQLYKTANGNLVSRDDFNKHSVDTKNTILLTEENLKNYTPSDLVIFDNTETLNLGQLMYNPKFKKLLKNGSLKVADVSNKQHLQWMNYYKIVNGEKQYISELSEYQELKAIRPKNINDKRKRDELERKLQSILNDGSWITEHSEFIMPRIHAAAYNLNENDTLLDILGDYDRTTEAGKRDTTIHATKFFYRRLKALLAGTSNLQKLASSGNAQAKILLNFKFINQKKIKSVEDVENYANRLSDKLSNTSKNALYLNSLKSELALVEKFINSGSNDFSKLVEKINENRDTHAEYVINLIATNQAKSFPKTLEFIVGRIPGQGKQSFTAGIIKGFLSSGKNSIHGPIEMLKITGGDHDGDKGNVIAYSVDDLGNIYDYSKYLDKNGSLSKDLFLNALQAVKNNEYASNEQLEKALEQEKNYAKEAFKNYILDHLLVLAKSPKNAIESATPTSMDNTQKAISKKNEIEFDDDNGGTVVGFGLLHPDNPGAIPDMEIIMSTGKSGVGIFATAIKVYSAAYASWLKDIDSTYVKFSPSKVDNLNLIYNNKKLNDVYENSFNQNSSNQDDFKIFLTDNFGNSIVKSSSHLANTLKYDFKLTEQAKERVEKIKQELDKLNLTEQQKADKLSELAEQALLDKSKSTEQAWEYISELLSAATDNAKEFILGRIGANNLTSGIIATQLMLGFDLKDVLEFFKSQEIQSLIKKVEDSRDLYKNETGYIYSLLKTVENEIKKKFKPSFVSNQIDKNEKEAEQAKQRLDVISSLVKYSDELLFDSKFKPLNDIDFLVYSNESFINPTGNLLKQNLVNPDEQKDLLVEYEQIRIELGKPQYNNIPDLLAQLKVIRDTDFTITDRNMGHELYKILLTYANSKGKRIYFVDEVDGNILNNDDSIKTLSGKVGIIKSLPDSRAENCVNSFLENTHLLINDPTKFDTLVNAKISLIEEEYKRKSDAINRVVNTIVTDGARQLQPFLLASMESRVLSSILKINQGLPSDDWGTFNYFNNIVNQLNKIIRTGDKFKVNDIINFFKSLSTDGVFAQELIDRYESNKIAFNPFYILKQNDHYLGYINSLIFSKDLIEGVNNIANIINNIAANEELQYEDEYKDLKQFIYAFSIDKFYNDNKEISDFSIQGKNYNLSTNNGRNEFCLDMVSIIQSYQKDPRLANNEFINGLDLDTSFDSRMNEKTTIIRTRDIASMQAKDRAVLEAGLEELRTRVNDDLSEQDMVELRNLYDALYHYSLILYKGGRSKESFSSLFNQNNYINLQYLKSLRSLEPTKTVDYLKNKISNLSLLIPSAIKVISTKNRPNYSSEYDDESYDIDYMSIKSNKQTRRDQLFNLPDSLIDDNSIIIKSKQTGKLYKWNGEKYVVITSKYPSRVIAFNFNEQNISELDVAGYQYGETAIINSNNEKGQVLYYDRAQTKYKIIDSNGNTKYLLEEELKAFNPNMTFRGDNFGKKTDYEFQLKDSDNKEEFSLNFSKKQLKSIINKGVRYIIKDNNVNLKPNDVIETKTIEWNGQLLTLKTVFLGNYTYKDKDETALRFYNRMADADKTNFRNASKDGIGIVEVILLTKPTIVSEQYIKGEFIGNRQEKLINGKAVAFHTSKEIATQIPKNSTKLIRMKYNNQEAFFNVTKEGTMKEALDKYGYKELASMLGYSNNESRNINDINLAINKSSEFFTITPYNGKDMFINSKVEMDLLAEPTESNLQDITLNLVNEKIADADLGSALFNKLVTTLGVENINTHTISEYEQTIDDELELVKSKLLSDKTLLFENENPVKNLNNILNSINESDTVVIFSNISEISSSTVNRLGVNKKPQQTAIVSNLIKILEQEDETITTDEDKLDYFTGLLNLINSTGLDDQKLAVFKNALSQQNKKVSNTDFLNAINSTIQYLNDSLKTNIPAKFLFNSNVNFAQVHAAKLMNKNLLVYDNNKQQWLNYNHQNGVFQPIQLPILEGSVAVFNGAKQVMTDEKSVSSLFAKSSLFRTLSVSNLQDVKVASEFSFNSIEPDNSMITPVNIGEKSLDELSNITKITKKNFDVETIGANDKKFVLQIDGKSIDIKEFIDNDMSNAKFSLFQDGSLLIENIKNGLPEYFVVFQDGLKKEYANFSGDKVFNDFKIAVGNNYYIINEAHQINNIQSFNLRNKLLQEKQTAKEKFELANNYKQNELSPLYKELRFGGYKKSLRFTNINSYNQFIAQLKNNMLDELLSENEIELKNKLIQANDNFEKLLNEAWDYVNEIKKKYKGNDIKVNISKSSFDDIDNSVLVTLIDSSFNFTQNKMFNKIKKGTYTINNKETRFHYSNKDDKDTLQAITLPVFDSSNSDKYYRNDNVLAKQLFALVDIATKNPNKTFIIDFPFNNISDKVFANISGMDMARAWSKAIAFSKIKKLPDNIIFNDKIGNIINNFDGDYNPSMINKVRPFRVTKNPLEENTFTLIGINNDTKFSPDSNESILDVWNRWRGLNKFNKDVFQNGTEESFVNKQYNNNLRFAYKALWRRWAELNPKTFNKIAMQIGNRAIYDKFYSENNKFSSGEILAELLTEKFVDNSWLSIPRNLSELKNEELNLNQTWIPVEFSKFKKMDFTNFIKGGKSLVNINDELYIATIESEAHSPYSLQEQFSGELLDNLDTPLDILEERYPFTFQQKFALLSLEKFDGELKDPKSFYPGEVFELLNNANIELSSEHKEFAKEATVVIPVDHLTNIATRADNNITSTTWINNIKSALNDNIVIDIKKHDKVWILGSKVDDVYNIDSIRSAFEQVKHIIDKAIQVNADIIIGSETGIEEQAKSYILKANKNYIYKNNKFTIGEFVPSTEKKIAVFSNISYPVARFNNNNDISRGQSISGATILAINSTDDYKKPYSFYSNNIKDFNSQISKEEVLNLINSLATVRNEESQYTHKRGELLIGEQLFIDRILMINSLIDNQIPIKAVYNIVDFHDYFNEVIESSSDVKSSYQNYRSDVFNEDGTFKYVNNTGLIAMSRNRNITLQYFSDLINNDVQKSPYYDLISYSRKSFEASTEYKNMISEKIFSEKDLSIILESNPSYKDLFYLATTIGNNIVLNNGILEGQKVGNLFSKLLNIDAALDNDKIFVFNNDKIIGNYSTANFDSSEPKVKLKKFISDGEKIIAEKYGKEYKYMKENGVLSVNPYNKNIRLFLNNKVAEFTEQEVLSDPKSIRDFLYSEITNLYYKYLPKEIQTSNIKPFNLLASGHIASRKSLFKNPWNELFTFKAQPADDAWLSTLLDYKLYSRNDKKFLLIPIDNTGKVIAVFEDMSIKNVDVLNNELLDTDLNIDISTGLNGVSVGVAMPSQKGITFESILYMDTDTSVMFTANDNVNGYTVSTRDSQTIAESFNKNSELIDSYYWNNQYKTWVKTDKTKKVNSEEFKGGFKNSKVKFQKNPITVNKNTNNASKIVSVPVLREVVNRLNKYNVNVVLLSSADIEAEFGKTYANKSGFTIGNTCYLNSNKATLDTPLHEFGGHIFLSYLKNTNSIAFQSVIEKSLLHPIAEDIKKLYPELNDEELGEEIFSTLVGLENQNKLEEASMSVWQSIKNIAEESSSILEFFKNLFNFVFNKTSDSELNINYNSSLLDIINQVGEALVFDKGSLLENLSNYNKNQLKNCLSKEFSEKEALDKLEKLGYIQQICQ